MLLILTLQSPRFSGPVGFGDGVCGADLEWGPVGFALESASTPQAPVGSGPPPTTLLLPRCLLHRLLCLPQSTGQPRPSSACSGLLGDLPRPGVDCILLAGRAHAVPRGPGLFRLPVADLPSFLSFLAATPLARSVASSLEVDPEPWDFPPAPPHTQRRGQAGAPLGPCSILPSASALLHRTSVVSHMPPSKNSFHSVPPPPRTLFQPRCALRGPAPCCGL